MGAANYLFKLLPRNCSVYFSKNVSYKSVLSLSNLYPNSCMKFTTPEKPSSFEKFSGFIPMDQIDITYSRSGGPGGQNINKVSTKVDIRFHVESAAWLDSTVKKKLLEKQAPKITKEGFLVIRSDLTRSQQLNLADCLEKLRCVIKDTMKEKPQPTLESEERARRRLEVAAQERLIMKRTKSKTKQDRRAPN